MTASYDLSDSVALVTGAAGDIGRVTAVRLARSGAALVLTDLDAARDALDETRRACTVAGEASRVLVVTADVSDPASVEACFDVAVERYRSPDLVFNNAGVQGALTGLPDYPSDDFPRVMAVNAGGVFNVLRETARRLRTEVRGGSIVNSASMAGVEGAANMVAYSASKGAVMSMTRSASKDLAPLGIRVNAISPAFIGPGRMWDLQTERQAQAKSQYYSDDRKVVEQEMIGMVPMRRTGTVDEVANAVVWLLSDAAAYVTGHNLIISGGI